MPPIHERKLSDDNDYNTLNSYFEEGGWFDRPIYIVWLCGATDGWPYAIFPDHESAVHWAKDNAHNPEGSIIEEADFAKLCHIITGVGKW